MTGLPDGAWLEVVYDARAATRALLLYVPGRGALVLGTVTDVQQVIAQEWAAAVDFEHEKPHAPGDRFRPPHWAVEDGRWPVAPGG